MADHVRHVPTAAPPPAEVEALIDLLYDAAVEPDRLGALIDRWEPVMAPLRRAVHAGDRRGLHPFDRHVVRLRRLLDGAARPVAPAALAGIERAAAFVIGPDLIVTAVNAAATRSLGLTPGDGLERLRFGPAESAALVARARAMFDAGTAPTVTLHGRTRDGTRALLLSLRLLSGGPAPQIVVITSETGWPVALPEMLRAAFGLTPAEIGVLRELARGAALPAIASSRGRSLDTVRAQLKSIMGKTDTRSQPELVRLVLSMFDMVPADPATPAPAPPAPDVVLRRMRLPDGRRLDYHLLGAPTGRPCLFLPPLYGPARWPAAVEAAASHKGLCVIVPLRPGQGGTAPPPPYADPVRQFIHDVAALLDHLVRDPVPVLSLGGESLVAMGLHRAHPRRVSALVACAGTLPVTRPEQIERMHKWHRAMLGAARYTPQLLPVLIEAGMARLNGSDGARLLREVYADSPADLALLEDPEIRGLLLARQASTTAGLSQELTRRSVMDWRPSLAALRSIPAHFLSGTQDPQMPPATLDEHQRDHPWIKLRRYPDAGQLLFYDKWRDALDFLDLYA
ncbi:alpha/beta fold hydrolase [Limimaricola hongkongensis]|uniref:Transcriptional regulator, LuxR family/hydrolase, alpha/beta fold family protein n=1 Tax=Limimaricola hongkongensis DSM 17492 TaxID=1122180 RepID=A0A017HA95_9RHOB|nr:alpha/beta fold hydrolase [Limimaricola hongkongensis]EYD71240.1 transcriptional regulator, LuxR family/hydrolase, alpha/beta fold family protein [Limimaricola hongkongensis DSM 17492]